MAIGKTGLAEWLGRRYMLLDGNKRAELLMGKFGSIVYDGLCSPFDSYSMTT